MLGKSHIDVNMIEITFCKTHLAEKIASLPLMKEAAQNRNYCIPGGIKATARFKLIATHDQFIQHCDLCIRFAYFDGARVVL